MRISLVVAFFLFMAGPANCQQTADAADRGVELIAKTKKAMGGEAWDRILVWHEVGHFSASSDQSQYEHWSDFQTLQFHNVNYENGTEHAGVFDGSSLWLGSQNKLVQTNVRNIKLGAYTVAFGFFFPDRFPAKVTYLGTINVDGKNCDSISVSATNIGTVEIWLDEKTHLLIGFVMDEGKSITKFSDYRAVKGMLLPFEERDGNDIGIIDKIEFLPPNPSLFDPKRN